ncbi:hypothetical protein [Enterobacter roggenkampii]|uniref:hypothetical protein n=1 Tax=Enterobacter roggenkampii TaxID=1812935 RepID=UPI002FF8CFD5
MFSFLNKSNFITIKAGHPLFRHQMIIEDCSPLKSVPDFEIYYFSKGIFKAISPSSSFYGLYSLQGDLNDDTYTLRYIGLRQESDEEQVPFTMCNFINDVRGRLFILKSYYDNGKDEIITTGRFHLLKHNNVNPKKIKWPKK